MKTILVPIDFQNASAKALSYIENVFNEQQVELQLLNVVSLEDKSLDEDIQQAFKDFESKYLKYKSIAYKFSIMRGYLLDEIHRAIHF
jgi:hypothetical protein